MDEEKQHDEFEREKHRSEVLTVELRKLLQKALKQGLDLDATVDFETGFVSMDGKVKAPLI